jgi:uncharacterized protein (DUF305 family)
MIKRYILSLFAIGFAVLSGFGLIASGLGATAHEEDNNCGTPTADSPFMGTSDPEAPYDLRFIDEMVMHHRGAIMSAEMMIGDSEHPELRDLAQRIQEDQQRQIEQMLAWRAEWYPDAAPPTITMDSMGSMMDGDGMMNGMMGGMMGSMMDGDMADRMFLRMMIPHHQLAIDMAEDALINAEHEELKTLAQEIIDGQSAEITEMEGYLRAWYDEASTRDSAATMRAMMAGC